MYSVILMTAMAAGAPETPSFGWRSARVGCTGCYGGCAGSCYGYSYGYSCYGSCHGCYGGCHGYYSSCHGCYGSHYYSGYYAPTYYGYGPLRSAGHAGWWGMVENYPVPPARPYGTIIYGPAVWGADYQYSGSTPFVRVTPTDEPKKAEIDKGLGGTARLVIDVPEGAKLTVDGNVMKSTEATRLFYTPKLDEGQAYYYDVAVEVPGEKPMTRRVYVHANQIVRESFQKPATPPGTGLASK